MDLPDAAQLTGQRLHEASSIGGRNLGRTPRLRMTLTYPPSSPRLPLPVPCAPARTPAETRLPHLTDFRDDTRCILRWA
jgi:hypothetical protein